MPVSYHTDLFPPKTLSWERLVPLLGKAHTAVARYEGLIRGIPNAEVLLSPLAVQEAVLSSRIEGTQTTVEEVLRFEAIQEARDERHRADLQEVLNYRNALRATAKMLDELPLSTRVVREAHRILMEGVRGRDKAPGEYRRLPVHIGPPGGSADTAHYIPLSAEQIPDAMSNWEKFLHSEQPDVLVQLALLHVEFEAIHPFLDGNGRVGRLLIPLYMLEKKLLTGPYFYLSAYLESHRDEYYHHLRQVSAEGDWTGWCEYFLKAVKAQADANQAKALAILELYREKKEWIIDLTRSPDAIRALDWFFGRIIFTTNDFKSIPKISRDTALRILRKVKKAGMLHEVRPASGNRPAVFQFTELGRITGEVDADDHYKLEEFAEHK